MEGYFKICPTQKIESLRILSQIQIMNFKEKSKNLEFLTQQRVSYFGTKRLSLQVILNQV
mgnify:CR=1 FL=1